MPHVFDNPEVWRGRAKKKRARTARLAAVDRAGGTLLLIGGQILPALSPRRGLSPGAHFSGCAYVFDSRHTLRRNDFLTL